MAEVKVLPTAGALAEAAAERIADLATECVMTRGAFHIALAGGNTPQRTYADLRERIDDWSQIHLWFGDERAVPPDDEESNFRMVNDALLRGLAIPADNVHRMAGELDPAEAARAYADDLRAHVSAGADGGVPSLDVALEGLGEDGHTASLFPGNPVLAERELLCAVVHDSPKPPPTRLTLTLPVLQAARTIVFLAAGAGKAEPVAAMLAGPDPAVPSSLLVGEQTELYLDGDAAALARERGLTT